ncbi:MAG TPA: hypothetical protein VL326_13350 [Kofleriaceae bacterium]|jgi:hypothetical protein|nr:hypothetical protein [Kofleriaceae bacterium]
MRSSVVLLCLAVSGTAMAGGAKPLVDPDKVADESTSFIEVGRSGDGYWVRAFADVMGIEKDDTLRLDIRHGKETGTQKCTFTNSNSPDANGIECSGANGGKIFTGAGPLEADLILHADKDDKEYLVRHFSVNVKNWDGKGEFQVEPDDTLGTAYYAPQDVQGTAHPTLRFWISNGDIGGSTLRCKVDGKPLGGDITGGTESRQGTTADIIKGNNRTTWHWAQVTFSAPRWVVKKVPNAQNEYWSSEMYPGTWECELRKGGVGIRAFKFVVDSKGEVASNAMGKAKGSPKLPPHYAMIDMTILPGNGIDQRIKPDAIKKSRGFGMPWPQDDSVKTLLAALPKAYENASPVAVKPKRQLIEGAKANPPRFVDESTAYISTIRSGDGYRIFGRAGVLNVAGRASEEYRLVVLKGGKEVGASTKCTQSGTWLGANLNSDESTLALFGTKDATALDCGDNDVAYKATGPLDVQLRQYDDVDGNEYILRTYKLNVVHPKAYGDPLWMIFPDDLLGPGWIGGNGKNAGGIKFRFWTSSETYPDKVRCTVDGKKVPDIKVSGGGGDASIEYDYRKTQNADQVRYGWYLMNLSTSNDATSGMPEKNANTSKDWLTALGEYPGNWTCDFRTADAKVLRTMSFHVNDKGYVDPSPAQAGELASPDVAPVDIKFGKDAMDKRVRPDAMKKGAGYGRPWPKGPPKDLPAKASGLPDLK